MSGIKLDEDGNIEKQEHINQHEFLLTLIDKSNFIKKLKRNVISALVVAGSLAITSFIGKVILEYFDKGKH